jgi:hypothetical protein
VGVAERDVSVELRAGGAEGNARGAQVLVSRDGTVYPNGGI